VLLSGKSVVIYGATNPIGATVARAFAEEGAAVYLAGRSPARLQPIARDILDAGGAAEVAEVDPLDMTSVSEHLHRVGVQHGTVDFSLNLAFLGIESAARLCNLTAEQFDAATFTRIRSNFVTAAAAVKAMAYQGRGTVLAIAVPERATSVGAMDGPAIGSAAIGALCEQLQADVGSFGVRIIYLADASGSAEELVAKLVRVLASPPTSSPSLEGMDREPGASPNSSPTGARAGVAST
jgi:3-oxoacyl-[acyl-carrier protein] reductase